MDILPLLILSFEIYLVFTIIVLLLDNREPSETFAWIFIFILMPGFGFFLYLVTGRSWKKSYDRKRKLPQAIAKNLVAIFKPLEDLQEEFIKQLKNKSSIYQDDLMRLLYRNSHSILTQDNELRIFHNGRDKFDSLLEDLKKAKQYIHMEYFIWRSNDSWGKALKELLVDKAKEGVEVRILYDFTGCFLKISGRYLRELRAAGIKIYPFFNYLSNFKIHTLNYRNHRKIVVIDGRVGYTGGMNIGQEYADGGKRYASWRDTHLRLEGEAVSVLEAVFAIDWYNTVQQEDIFEAKYYPLVSAKKTAPRTLPIQLPTSGYDSAWPSILHLFFAMITMAQKNIHITSPYFIPEPSLIMALKIAAMRGVKVVVLMTGVPDNLITYWAAFSYFEELLKAGVRIFQYQKGFMHAKIITCDSKVCSIGTTNFDIRSLKLNYEINAVIYDEKTTQETDAQFMADLEHSKEITLTQLNQTSVVIRLRNSLVRLVSPIL